MSAGTDRTRAVSAGAESSRTDRMRAVSAGAETSRTDRMRAVSAGAESTRAVSVGAESDRGNAPACAWVELSSAGLRARAFRVARVEVAFFKHLFESYEDVALVRTAATLGDEVILAVVAPPDSTRFADEILADVERRGSPALAPAELPPHCREDWFLEEWA